jgi:hypothetical protein
MEHFLRQLLWLAVCAAAADGAVWLFPDWQTLIMIVGIIGALVGFIWLADPDAGESQ